MKTVRLASLLFYTHLLAVGCGGPPGPSVGDGSVGDGSARDAPTTAETILALCADATRHCQSLYACGDEARLLEDGFRFGHHDVESCTDVMGRIFDAQCHALVDGVARGTHTVDLTALAECRATLAASSCEDYLELARPIDLCMSAPIATGPSPNFGDCSWDQDCSDSGDICSSAPDGEHMGYCDVGPERGELCHGGRCAPGLLCDSLLCVDPHATDGCRTDRECAAGTWCDQPGNDWREDSRRELLGTCTPPRGIGEPCDSASACLPGLHCTNWGRFDPDGFRSAGTCIEPHPTGKSCSENPDCVSGRCVDLLCD